MSHDTLNDDCQVMPPTQIGRTARGASGWLWWLVTLPFALVGRFCRFWLRLASRLIRFPFALSRRRISVQLIYSYVLVVVLTALVVELVGIGAAVIIAGHIVTNDQLDTSMGDRALAMAQVLGGPAPAVLPASMKQPTKARETRRPVKSVAPMPQSIPASNVPASVMERIAESVSGWLATVRTAAKDYVNAADRYTLEKQLTLLTQAPPRHSSSPPPEASAIGGGKVADALVTDATGRVVASSNHTWAPLGEPVEAVNFSKISEVTRRAIELRGRPTQYGNLYVLDEKDGYTAAAYPLLSSSGQLLGVVALQSHHVAARVPVLDLLGGIGLFSIAYLVFLAGAALVVAIPIGIWRARSFSRRLKRLATAADAMAHGDLNRRVPVTGQDEIARLSERFNEMSEQLSETDRARKAFVANISHELRTPVAILQGTIERLMTRRPALPADVVTNGATRPPATADTESATDSAVVEPTALRVMHQETATLSRLIDDLFTLARIEETALPLEIAVVHVDEIASEAATGLRPLAWEQRKVTVQSLITPATPPVLADTTRLRQILNNLLYNALRHTPEGGVIIIDAVTQESVVEIAVTDTGIGISPDHLASVFERFYQAERGHRHHDGSGLGLHIVKQLVEAQQGTISVESALGQGTTFRFTLPRAV